MQCDRNKHKPSTPVWGATLKMKNATQPVWQTMDCLFQCGATLKMQNMHNETTVSECDSDKHERSVPSACRATLLKCKSYRDPAWQQQTMKRLFQCVEQPWATFKMQNRMKLRRSNVTATATNVRSRARRNLYDANDAKRMKIPVQCVADPSISENDPSIISHLAPVRLQSSLFRSRRCVLYGKMTCRRIPAIY